MDYGRGYNPRLRPLYFPLGFIINGWFDVLLMTGRIKPIPNSLLSPPQRPAAFLAFCAPLAYTRF